MGSISRAAKKVPHTRCDESIHDGRRLSASRVARLPETHPADAYAWKKNETHIKPKKRDVTDGLEKTAARGMLRAVGMGDDDWVKSQIGVASSWNEITPCNLSLDRLAKAVKNGVHAAGGYPPEVGTISVSAG